LGPKKIALPLAVTMEKKSMKESRGEVSTKKGNVGDDGGRGLKNIKPMHPKRSQKKCVA